MTVSEAYHALGLDPSASTPQDVRSRFKRLILSSHPDVFADADKFSANETTIRLIDAYETLKTAGFPRPAHPETPATAQTAWRGQFDEGDLDFDAWLHDLKLSSLYATDVLRYGTPSAIARALFMAVGGTLSGAGLLLGSLSAGAWGHGEPGVLLLAPVGLAVFLFSVWYLVSPIAYYTRKGHLRVIRRR